MNATVVRGTWQEIKSRIQSKWSLLTEAEIDSLRYNLYLLVGKIQKAYGYSRDRAEQEYAEFKATFQFDEPLTFSLSWAFQNIHVKPKE